MSKKQTIITIVIVALAFIVGFFVGDSSAIHRVNKQISASTEETGDNKSTTKEEPKEEIKSIQLNTEAQVGDLGIKVLEAKESTAVSNEAGKSTPTGKFIVIKLELKNNSKEAIGYDTNDFKLKNNDILYEVDDNAFDALGNLNSQETIFNKNSKFIGVYDKFNAGVTKNTYIVFDVPKETKIEDLKLIVKQNKNIEFNLK